MPSRQPKAAKHRGAAGTERARSGRLTLAEQYDASLIAERRRSESPIFDEFAGASTAARGCSSRRLVRGLSSTRSTPTTIVAMDCEYVGVGYLGKEDQLARVSLLDVSGRCIYDEYVKPQETVVDYRTHISGVRVGHLRNAKKSFGAVQHEVRGLLDNKLLVGHGLRNDLRVLGLMHPSHHIRDTATYKPLRTMANGAARTVPKLRDLAYHLLGVQIQQGEHDSICDARVALRVYLLHQRRWEADFQRGWAHNRS